MKKTKIICSIGPASTNPDIMEKMVNEGMNVARINFSHSDIKNREEIEESVIEVRKRTGKNIGLLFDTKGPEFRNGMIENNHAELVEGKTFRIVKEEVVGNSERFSVNHPEILSDLNIGDILLLDDGLMRAKVISKEEDGATFEVVNGGVLVSRKSLNVP